MANTAINTQKDSGTGTIIFRSEEHKTFFLENISKCRHKDVYNMALFYTLGIDRDTRQHIGLEYDFHTSCIKTECLHDGWITSGSARIIRLAFNLFCNGMPSLSDYEENSPDALAEAGRYSVEDLFCCGYAKYFWQAVKIRYPEYC